MDTRKGISMVKCLDALNNSDCGKDICCYECDQYDDCPLACVLKDHEHCCKRIETECD